MDVVIDSLPLGNFFFSLLVLFVFERKVLLAGALKIVDPSLAEVEVPLNITIRKFPPHVQLFGKPNQHFHIVTSPWDVATSHWSDCGMGRGGRAGGHR